MHTAAVAISQINIITLRSYVHVQEHTRCQLAPRPQQVHKKVSQVEQVFLMAWRTQVLTAQLQSLLQLD